MNPEHARRPVDETDELCDVYSLSGVRTGYLLSPETEPAAIAADQRLAVAAALRAEPGADAARVSDLVDLPASVAARRMAELAKGVRP